MGKTLILGVGNVLLSDDGVGVHVVRRLEEVAELPPEVEVLDGGTKGMDLLHYLEGVSRLLIIDAVETDGPPGTLVRLTGDQVPAYLSIKMSPHEIGLPDMLFAAKLRDLYPEEVVVLGVQPATTEVGLDLSEPVAARVDELVEKVLAELEGWGIGARRREVRKGGEAGMDRRMAALRRAQAVGEQIRALRRAGDVDAADLLRQVREERS